MYKIFLFAGTTEGRKLSEFLNRAEAAVYVFTATEYGESLVEHGKNMILSHERLSAEEMEAQIRREKPDLVLDATHPYAQQVTENIRTACINTHTEYVRLVREEIEKDAEDVVYADSAQEASEFLSGTEGNILLTTGSKDLALYTAVPDYGKRIYARVLSLPEVVKDCAELGFQGSHLICMQGPFSAELNTAMLRQYNCRWMVTKDSGKEGGFLEKQKAARQAGARLLVIGRPVKESGLTLKECRQMLYKRCRIPFHPAVCLAGIGMGGTETMTAEAVSACRKADLLIGAKRPLETARKAAGESSRADTFQEYRAEEILSFIRKHPFYEQIVIAMSGDLGFYSGAKKLYQLLLAEKEWSLKAVCGISSLSYFMSRIHLSWEDAVVVNSHSQKAGFIHTIASNRKVFAVLGTGTETSELAEELLEYGMDDVTLYVGERLSYPDENIRSGKPSEFLNCKTDALSVLCAVNDRAEKPDVTHGMRDDLFLRGKVPMTKEEVRSITLSKLCLTEDAVCYDIGAGTGSVSVEMALRASGGRVYAVEKNPEAAELLYENRRKFYADSIQIIEGTAPEALSGLEAPTHVFIGGSSGNLYRILETVLYKNPKVRIVINCITLETLSEAVKAFQKLAVTDLDVVNVSVGKAKKAGNYHLMMGENPVFILSCTGNGEVNRED
ncbi:precorrin-6A reductase [Anaerostipes sp.]|uniref:precorrin-6A reductase n=1 Tax=Anaerostipes sp. TaxID=1872530 RepID=UPI0025BD756A|nr:precorrin-6A reductase [Anaerostipes sp.]MBS7007394.1 precorrin-6A reductase [Anaerostipes sp.]